VEDNKAVTLYETLFVVHPEKGPRMKEFIERFKKVVEGQEGIVSQVDEWGLRDLAYRIEKQGKGFYTLMRYKATGRAVEELERNLKLTDGILRYLTVRTDDDSPTTNPSAPRAHSDEPRRTYDDGGPRGDPSA
jgi:small subunit ribosomal protein S6